MVQYGKNQGGWSYFCTQVGPQDLCQYWTGPVCWLVNHCSQGTFAFHIFGVLVVVSSAQPRVGGAGQGLAKISKISKVSFTQRKAKDIKVATWPRVIWFPFFSDSFRSLSCCLPSAPSAADPAASVLFALRSPRACFLLKPAALFPQTLNSSFQPLLEFPLPNEACSDHPTLMIVLTPAPQHIHTSLLLLALAFFTIQHFCSLYVFINIIYLFLYVLTTIHLPLSLLLTDVS